MDHIHEPELREWISEKVNLGLYFAKFSDLVNGDDLRTTKANYEPSFKKFKKLVGIPDDILFEELEAMCCSDKLTISGEMKPLMHYTDEKIEKGSWNEKVYPAIQPPNINCIPEDAAELLQTLKQRKDELEKKSYNDTVDDRKKVILKSITLNEVSRNKSDFDRSKLTPGLYLKEILITVRIYRARSQFNQIESDSSNIENKAFKFSQEIILIGSNTLANLKDSIKCSADFVMSGDFSEILHDQSSEGSSKDIYKSSFFCIEGCFYNDMRHADSKDLSQVIRDWASLNRRKVGPFSTAKMENVKLSSLSIRPGYPYVYVHQGNHEHLVVFLSPRLVSYLDCQKKSEYPFVQSIGRIYGLFCMVCRSFPSRWIVTDHKKLPEDPYFFCDRCYVRYNFSEKGEPIESFTATKYIDTHAI